MAFTRAKKVWECELQCDITDIVIRSADGEHFVIVYVIDLKGTKDLVIFS